METALKMTIPYDGLYYISLAQDKTLTVIDIDDTTIYKTKIDESLLEELKSNLNIEADNTHFFDWFRTSIKNRQFTIHNSADDKYLSVCIKYRISDNLHLNGQIRIPQYCTERSKLFAKECLNLLANFYEDEPADKSVENAKNGSKSSKNISLTQPPSRGSKTSSQFSDNKDNIKQMPSSQPNKSYLYNSSSQNKHQSVLKSSKNNTFSESSFKTPLNQRQSKIIEEETPNSKKTISEESRLDYSDSYEDWETGQNREKRRSSKMKEILEDDENSNSSKSNIYTTSFQKKRAQTLLFGKRDASRSKSTRSKNRYR